MTERDFDANPYSPDEARVAKWLADLTGAGGGDDPIGFLMATNQLLVQQRNKLRQHFIRSRLRLGFDPIEAREHLDDAENGA